MDEWKAIRLNLNNSEEIVEELYNLKEDPREMNNVINDYPDIIKKIEPLFTSARDDDYPISLFGN